MVGECAIITALLLFAALGLIKSKRKKWALATLPLMVLPLVNSLAKLVSEKLLGIEFTFIGASVTIMIALIVSCTAIGFVTATILSRRKYRISYMVGCIVFNILLALALLFNYYGVLTV